MNAINLTMAAALAVLYSVGFFLLMQRSLMRVLLGIVVLGHVANLFPRWDRAGGKEVAGLLARRNAERALFLTPD